jgi:predicted AlkP superfamily phosphohydrolase/phosphomutase
MLIGLDCVPPALGFERFAAQMPCLSALRSRGTWATLRSTTPPITVPAWTAMISGRDPGELGLYGFRARPSGAYTLRTVDSRDVHCERVWDVLARHGKRSALLCVPPSYPPFKVHGELVSCFMTPSAAVGSTYPERLHGELAARFGTYVPDVDVRAGGAALFEALCAMTRQHFAYARHLWETRDPDFLMLVEIGPDRLHHALYATLDECHPRHDPRSADNELGARYYALLDAELARLIALADDDTSIVVASDHGARPLTGCFHINQWLIERGLLVLRTAPSAPCALTVELVDWSRTKVWAEGGYYARVFVNVRGREAAGCVEPAELPALCDQLQRALEAVPGPAGEVWQNRVERPARLYRQVRGDAPDLLAFFDQLNVRALGSVGVDALYVGRDPRGGDAANHDPLGIFVLAGAGVTPRGAIAECSIQDVGASVLALLGVAQPADWLGSDRSGPA